MKQMITVYVDKNAYKEFKIQSVMQNKSISERINEFIKQENKKSDGGVTHVK